MLSAIVPLLLLASPSPPRPPSSSRRGEAGAARSGGASSAPSPSALTSAAVGNAEEDSAPVDGWGMRRDARDEWLDEALIERPPSSSDAFETASRLVERFLADDAIDRPPLRRIDVEGFDDGDRDEGFDLLFGAPAPPSSAASEVDAAPLARRKRTSKKRKKRTTLKLTVAYRGSDFCGWEDQRHELYRADDSSGRSGDDGRIDEDGSATADAASDATRPPPSLPSVQGTLADVLGPLLGRGGASAVGSEGGSEEGGSEATTKRVKPLEVKVAGRTDKGVSAIGQVCRVRTWTELEEVESRVTDEFNRRTAATGLGARIRSVEVTGDEFHPSFGAKGRSYVYLVDLDEDSDGSDASDEGDGRAGIAADLAPRMDRMLRALEGKELDYFAFSHGKVKTQTTMCTLIRARACVAEWTGDDADIDDGGPKGDVEGIGKRAICVELAGDRFLRRMVRILVGTALREAHGARIVEDREGSGEGGRRGEGDEGRDDALLRILSARDRRLRSRAAPPDGLVFVGAKF
ncbi:hypothetical protein ACHAWF_007389 [Thalassiosira exigua]